MTPDSGSEFLAEAEELLEALGLELQAVEQHNRAGDLHPQRLNALFRHVHSLKGIAGFFGRRQLGRLAHVVEDFLDGVRMGRVPLDEASLDSLFLAHEQMEAMAAPGGEAMVASEALLERLAGVQNADSHAAAGRSRSQAAVSRDVAQALTAYEEHRLQASVEAGRTLWFVSLCLDMDTFDGVLRQLVHDLNQEGEVISTLPCHDPHVPQGQLTFRLLYAGSADGEKLAGLLPEKASVDRVGGGDSPQVSIRADAEPPATGSDADGEGEPEAEAPAGGSVRVALNRLDAILDVVGELLIFKRHIENVARDLRDQPGTRDAGQGLHKAATELDKRLQDLQRTVIGARMVPLGRIAGRLTRLTRKLGRHFGKPVILDMEGSGTELDKMLIDRLQNPLMHLVRNAICHGIEEPDERQASGKPAAGKLVLRAAQRGNEVVLTLEDDGRGLDREAIRAAAMNRGLLAADEPLSDEEAHSLILQPGFSSLSEAGEISGRGFGLDVVQRELQAVGGHVGVRSTVGRGTAVEICLPITLAIMPCMVVRAAGMEFAIPVAAMTETLRYATSDVESIAGRQVLRLRGDILPYTDLRQLMDPVGGGQGLPGFVVVARNGETRMGLAVDELMGHHEVVIKPVCSLLERVPGVAGATELGAGRAALVLDLASLPASPSARGAA